MAVTTTDAQRILTTDLAPSINRVQEVARRRLAEIETHAARVDAVAADVKAKPSDISPGVDGPPITYTVADEPAGVWLWWDEWCWGELIHGLRSYSLDGQATLLEQQLRRVLLGPHSVVQPTLADLHEAERLALREILQLTEQWLAEPADEESPTVATVSRGGKNNATAKAANRKLLKRSETWKLEEDLVNEWERYYESGGNKKDFAKQKDMSLKALNRAINAFAKRKSRAEHKTAAKRKMRADI